MRSQVQFLLVAVFLIIVSGLQGQEGVSINADGSAPHPSAMLDVNSLTKGLLPPRMTEQQIYDISSPAAGLVVYNIDQQVPVYFDGIHWRKFDGTHMTVANSFPGDALFVSPYGCDLEACGDITMPFLTISYALQRAFLTGISNVFVANGVYNETVEMRNGISLYGGYNPDTWESYPPATQTIIQGNGSLGGHTVTVVAEYIDQNTILHGFVIYGTECTSAGKNSYAIYLTNPLGEVLDISGNYIFAARGAPGEIGVNGVDGVDGENGMGRDADTAAYDAFNTGESQCTGSNDRQYQNGGVMIVGPDEISGGDGGGNQCYPVYDTETSATDGANGNAGTGGSGGLSLGNFGSDGAAGLVMDYGSY